MYFLTYTSKATSSLDIEDLLAKARTNNAAHDVTGLLIVRPQMFFQLLEGRKSDVLAIFSKIAVDPRHDRIRVLFEVEVENGDRLFPSWQMGCVSGEHDEDEATLLDELRSVLKSDSPPEEKVLRMLRRFAATRAPTSAREVLERANRP